MNKDYEEDFCHENGKYQNTCCICGHRFYGHKRRVVCKVCINRPKRKKLAQQHINQVAINAVMEGLT